MPRPGPTGLPIETVADEVRAALARHGSAVLAAPPGSGKTTVMPLRLMDTVPGKIVVLEPRRLATRAAARRMASLLGEAVGETVGYVTRHDRAVSRATRIEVVTEGVLTRRLQADPTLAGTSLIVFDEFHERNLQTDTGLALTIDIRSGLRPDLQVLVMSATIDAGPVAELLDGAPIVEADVPGFPVDLRWMPAPHRSRRLEDHVAAVVRRALAADEGDLLVFLPGMAEIRRVADRLGDVMAEVRPLHGSLPVADQDLALAPSPLRKVVLSTDIAESSLTVEGTGVVVDSGLARAPRFDPRTGMTRLRTIPISRASADQRAGRAGRTGPGVAYRLWSKMEHAARRPQLEPEITQVDLAGLALELAHWGVSDPAALQWLDHPPGPAWSEAVDLLERLGAVEDGRLTDRGRSMTRIPLHPRLARMIVDSEDQAGLAVWLATVVDSRDLIPGAPTEVPVDITLRVRLLTDRTFRLPGASLGQLQALRATATDLAERAGVGRLDEIDLEQAGRVLALGFPDRLAVKRGGPGRFQLRGGTTAVVAPDDPMATEEFLVVADLDGRRRDARIRLAAALDRTEVTAAFEHELDRSDQLVWDGDRLVSRHEVRLGGLALGTTDRRPEPSEAATAALVKRVKDAGLHVLPWSAAATGLRERVRYLREGLGDAWPDWSDSALRGSLDSWLAPWLAGATGWDEVERLDLVAVLRSSLDHQQRRDLERLAPTHILLDSGRKLRVDYGRARPTVSVRVQHLYGTIETPEVAGLPVTLELLSPAGRPIQLTSDLAGFWSGSWQQVRKEMAGRYPKHSWPEHPNGTR